MNPAWANYGIGISSRGTASENALMTGERKMTKLSRTVRTGFLVGILLAGSAMFGFSSDADGPGRTKANQDPYAQPRCYRRSDNPISVIK